jgi:hypothetical protein
VFFLIFSSKNLKLGRDCPSVFFKDVEAKDINGNFQDSGVKLTESEQSNSKIDVFCDEQTDTFSIANYQIGPKKVRSDCRSITSTIEDFFYSQDSQTESEISDSKTGIICDQFDTQNDHVEKCGPESPYYRLIIFRKSLLFHIILNNST